MQATEEIQASELVTWPTLPRDAVVARLSVCYSELFLLYQELGQADAEKARAEVYGYAGSPESTVGGRERDATAQALPARMNAIELRAKIQSFEAAREFGHLLVESAGG